MKIYITRHGQVCPADFYGSTDFPAGDIPLTDNGKSQANMLAEELKKRGFCGKIYASPYRRTLMSAEAVAKECGSKIYPAAALREKFFTDDSAQEHIGLNLSEIIDEFKHIAADAVLKQTWWERKADTDEMIAARLERFWEEILESEQEELLAVGHGASVMGSLAFFNKRFDLGLPCSLAQLSLYLSEHMYNCFISCFETDDKGKLVSAQLFYSDHLTENLITSNANIKPRPKSITI